MLSAGAEGRYLGLGGGEGEVEGGEGWVVAFFFFSSVFLVQGSAVILVCVLVGVILGWIALMLLRPYLVGVVRLVHARLVRLVCLLNLVALTQGFGLDLMLCPKVRKGWRRASSSAALRRAL